MKVIKRISNGKYVYAQLPEWVNNEGLNNTVSIKGGNISDYEEIEITQEEWNIAITQGNVEE